MLTADDQMRLILTAGDQVSPVLTASEERQTQVQKVRASDGARLGSYSTVLRTYILTSTTATDFYTCSQCRWRLAHLSSVYVLTKDAEFKPGGLAALNIHTWLNSGGARTNSAGLMLGSGEAVKIYYVLAVSLLAVLERC